MIKKKSAVLVPGTPSKVAAAMLMMAASILSCAGTSCAGTSSGGAAGSSTGKSGKGSSEVSPAVSLAGGNGGGFAGGSGGANNGGAGIGGDNYAGISDEEALPVLENLAEMERTGGFVPGLGLAESNVRERSGDYAGAVLAVYKELSWAYSMGVGSVSREAILAGLNRLLDGEVSARFSEDAQNKNAMAVKAISAFWNSRWEEAEHQLGSLYGGDREADSYSRWMLLVCALENGNAEREVRSAYASIRSRYASFPEYWYRAARAGFPNAADYAEMCINLAPLGPYAAECRIILAKSMGLSQDDAPALKTRLEIESLISTSVNQRNPELLAELLPLAGLPDNPSTLYAAGAMRALAAELTFRNWFAKEAEKAQGRRPGTGAGSRLADRLLYIARG